MPPQPIMPETDAKLTIAAPDPSGSNGIAEKKKKVVIDLSRVTFMASLGIRTLIMSCKTLASKGGDMVLLNPQPNVEKVLRTSGVDTVIQIVPDMNAAAAIFAK